LDEQKSWIDAQGWRLVVVHMGDDRDGLPSLGADVEQIADPHCELYRSFGLTKATLWQILRPRIFLHGLTALAKGYRSGALAGDGLQMPGVFLIKDAQIVRSHRALHVADQWPAAKFAGMLEA
jgi:hypothetical protein